MQELSNIVVKTILSRRAWTLLFMKDGIPDVRDPDLRKQSGTETQTDQNNASLATSMASRPVTRSARNSNASSVIIPSTIRGKPVRKSNSLWFEDGNVVLFTLARDDDTQYYAAKVHRSVLSCLSPVLKGIIDVLDDEKEKEMFDGALLVPLVDDSEDLKAFLKHIYGQR